MKLLVPIIGHDLFDEFAFLKERVLDIVESMGFESGIITEGNIYSILRSSPIDISIPLIIVVSKPSNNPISQYSHITTPLLEKFKSAITITGEPQEIPRRLHHLRSTLFLSVGDAKSGYVQRAISYINHNIDNCMLCTADIANNACTSKSKLENLFHAELGKSIWQYTIERRIEEARRLLKDTDLPISEIAIGVGYNDPVIFDRIFKKKLHLTPRQCRQKVNLKTQKVYFYEPKSLSKIMQVG